MPSKRRPITTSISGRFAKTTTKIKTFLKKILRKLGFLKKPSDKYYQDIEGSINAIDDVLREHSKSKAKGTPQSGSPTFLKVSPKVEKGYDSTEDSIFHNVVDFVTGNVKYFGVKPKDSKKDITTFASMFKTLRL